MKAEDANSTHKSTTSFDKNRLIRELEHSEIPLVKKNAIRELVRLHAVKAIPQIIYTLRDRDWDVREEAANALDRLGWQKDGGVREAWYHMIKGNWNDLKAIGPKAAMALSDALTCENKQTKLKAIEVINDIGGDHAAELLISALTDKDWQIAMQAARTLGTFKWNKKGDEEEAIYQIAWAHWERLVEIGSAAIKPLLEALKHGDDLTRARAAQALGRIGHPNGISGLVRAFKDQNWNVRKLAAIAAEKLGWRSDNPETEAYYLIAKNDWSKCIQLGRPAIQPLISVLKQKQKQFHDHALATLVAIGHPAIEPLKKLQAKSIVNVAQKIETALHDIDTTKKTPPKPIYAEASITEQRQRKRIDIVTLVYFICLSERGKPEDQGIGRLLNISSGGLLIETPQYIDCPYIAIYGVGLEENMMNLKGKVIHCRKRPNSSQYASGISFIDKNEKRLQVIAEFVRVFNRQKQHLPLSNPSTNHE